MKNGKKSVALRLVYDAFEIVQQKTGKNPIDVMEAAMKNVGPFMEVRPRRVGGATYQVPMEVASDHRVALRFVGLLLLPALAQDILFQKSLPRNFGCLSWPGCCRS